MGFLRVLLLWGVTISYVLLWLVLDLKEKGEKADGCRLQLQVPKLCFIIVLRSRVVDLFNFFVTLLVVMRLMP